MKRTFAFGAYLLAAAATFPGCTSLTEYETLVEATVSVYDSDLQLIRQAKGFQEARSILTVPGYLLVLTGAGEVLKVDSETLEIVETVLIGQAGSSGYSRFAESPTEGTIYVIGPMSTIYEIKLSTLEVTDTFFPCNFPSRIASSDSYPSYTFIADGSTNTVHIFRSNTNNLIDTWTSTSGGISDIAASDSDTTLIATEFGVHAIIMDQISGMQCLYPYDKPIVEIEYFPWHELYVCCSNGELLTLHWDYDPASPDVPILVCSDPEFIDGMNFMMDCGPSRYAWILCYQQEEGHSSLTRFDLDLKILAGSVIVPGVPMDIHCSGSGLVYVLSMEVE